MRKQDKLYYKNRRQPSPEKSHKLKSLKHLIQSRKAYWNYVEDEHSPEETFSISTKFYTFIKHKKTDSTGIKTLKKNGSTVTDPEQKADLLNNHFYSVFFSQQIPKKLSALCKFFTNLSKNEENDMPEIFITERGVFKLFKTKGAQGTLLGTGPYSHFAFPGIPQPKVSSRYMETCQCEPYIQERRQDKSIKLPSSVSDLHIL